MVPMARCAPSNYSMQYIWNKGGLLGEERSVRTWEKEEAVSEP